MVHDLQKEILRLKKEKDFCILAHSYMSQDITEIADYTGDSYGLSVSAAKVPQSNILMCGVRFMAETAKLLNPEKHVYISNSYAGCPMAEQLSPEELTALKAEYPGHTVVAYINTTAALKTQCDVCVTSSSAVKIVEKIENENILFIPDCNLGAYVRKAVSGKNIRLIRGGCPVHSSVTVADVSKAKLLHPSAKLLVHPECTPEVCAMADYIGSTTGIMDYVAISSSSEFIIGTELAISEHLSYDYPDKSFYPLSSCLVCRNMKLTSLPDVKRVLENAGGEEIILDSDTLIKARKCIDEMIRLGE